MPRTNYCDLYFFEDVVCVLPYMYIHNYTRDPQSCCAVLHESTSSLIEYKSYACTFAYIYTYVSCSESRRQLA